ncbi:MAG: tetratricopeptide repeat protein [Planctomycetes bacterium]|nr:tetratricopeptide repeat protein [Planctomycetota bacterium]
MNRNLLPLLLLTACSTLSSEERDKLAFHQRNAKIYYDSGKYEQAMGQIDRGLRYDPDDYLLNSLHGAILLRFSGSALGTEHRQLDEATALLAKVYDQRSVRRHEPYLLLNYALALQKQGRRQLGSALSLEDRATRAGDGDALRQQAAAARATGREQLLEARRLLLAMVERGDQPRLGNYHLLLLAQDLNDPPGFDQAERGYLEQLAKDQRVLTRNKDLAVNPVHEQEFGSLLDELKREEIDARSLLAEEHFFRKDYQRAAGMLDRVLELDPSRTADYYNRGRALLELGRAEAAHADFRKFLAQTDLPPDHEKRTFAYQALLR